MVAQLAPNFALGRSNLGAAQVLNGNFAEAIPNLEKAIELDSKLLDAHTNLGSAYMRTDNFDKAVDVLFKALSIDPLAATTHSNLSAALYRRERHETAEHHARRAIELQPDAREPYLHLGNALASSGKIDEAVDAFLIAASGPPVGLSALSRLIQTRKTEPGSPELELLEKYLAHVDELPPEPKSTLHFAAGKAHEGLGDFARAFDHFRQANDITKANLPFDAETFRARNKRILEFCSPELMRRCDGGGISDIAPVFICGMPRSGTTLMDQMFSCHPKVQAGGELRASFMALQQNQRIRDALEEKLPDADITADDFTRLGEAYTAAIRAEGIRSEYSTDKMPANYRHLGLLALALPRAKFLIMRRHPLDCLLSNYVQNFGRNQPFANDFERMAVVFDEFDKAANHWSQQLPDRVRQVSYEDVIADAEGQMRSILDFVGLDWAPEVLDFQKSSRQVNTASMAQIREPIYTSSMARWEKYGTQLAPLAEMLQNHLSAEDLAKCRAV